jgi:hypothetical protein
MQNIKLGEDCCSNETESELQLCVEPTVTESTDLEVAEFVLDRVYASVAERIELASVETENGSEEPVDAAETEETAQVDETAEVVDCTADTPVNLETLGEIDGSLEVSADSEGESGNDESLLAVASENTQTPEAL